MTNKSSTVTVNIDNDIKDKANKILKDLGLNMSSAITMYLMQIIKKEGIPFEISNTKISKDLKDEQ